MWSAQRQPSRRLLAALGALALTCAGCTRSNPNAGDPGADGGTQASARDGGQDAGFQAGDAAKGGDSSATIPSREAYCAGNGPPVLVGDQGSAKPSICTGDLAQVTFRFAICSCDPVTLAGALYTDAFDHDKGPYAPQKAHNGGAAGLNGTLTAVGAVDVRGPLHIGSGGAQLFSDGRVRGDLRCRGDISHTQELRIDGDATVDGSLFGAGSLNVAGTLTQPAGALQTSLGGAVGKHKQATVAITPPCDCAPEHILDIAKLTATYASANDNVQAKFASDALISVVGQRTLEVPCGRLYLDRIGGAGDVILEVKGRSALFVGGDVLLGGGLRVELASPKAELDLFIAGNVTVSGGLDLGDGQAPSRIRLYVGGQGSLNLAASARIGGNVYAPHATVSLAAGVEVFGSLFVGRLSTAGDVTVHYDLAVLHAGDDCPPPPGGGGQGDGASTPPPPAGCDSCRDCGNQACVDGRCGACTVDADCCAPLRCAAGRCIAPIL